MTELIVPTGSSRSKVQGNGMKTCEGFPQIGCPNDAIWNLLGYQLCETCADNWRKQPTHEDEHTGALIIALRAELAALKKAALAAYAVLDDELSAYDADSGPPPAKLLNAHALLFEALGLTPEPEVDQQGDDYLPF